jgi:pSer/pThr/pTyr-binding forkhead associated (FHA) protein
LLLDRTLLGTTAVIDPGQDRILATLRIRSGLAATATLPIRRPQATVGSDPVSDVVIDGPGVARRHGQLRLRGGVWTFVDFGSASGSSVDGSAVRGEALLAPGSSVRVGSVEMAFGPSDRWEDSPPERRAEDRTPLLLMPPERRTRWPLMAGLAAVAGIVVAAYFLLRSR